MSDQDFVWLVDKVRQDLTKKVMARSTSDPERTQALAEYHALDTVIKKMANEARNAEAD